MEKKFNNIEESRNTDSQLTFYQQLNEFITNSPVPLLDKMRSPSVYTTRQVITRFIERYELYNLIKNVPGNIVECGVGSGYGIMTLAHLCSIFEPYHYVRRLIGFDTFEGFVGFSEQDISAKAKAEHMKVGGLKFDTYETLLESIRLYDMNRAVGHINKVELRKGDISETFPQYLSDDPSMVISLLYLDMDLYKPTLDTIKLAIKRMPKGAVIVFDELNHTDYPGETLALMDSIGINNLRLKRFDCSPMLGYAVIGE
ncbi:MAG: hypothetical protein ACI9J4_000117 [Paraglaciecola sp.]|jgi:hypothetical protein